MKEKVAVLFLLSLIALTYWILVLSKGFRGKIQRLSWGFSKLNREQKEMSDATYLAGALVGAIAFTIMLAVAIILAIVRDA